MIVPEGWRAPALADLLVVQPNRKLVQQGWSPQCLASPAPAHAWGVLKTTAIQAGWFDDTQHKELPDGLAPRPAIEVKVGDLLITCAGPRARCGIPALVRSTRPRLMMSGKMYRFRPEPQLDAKYLEFWLLSPEAQRRIDRMKTGISDSGLNLTHSRFLQLPVPYPELLEQRRIVAILEEHLSDLEAACASLDAARTRASGLPSLLAEREIRMAEQWTTVAEVSELVTDGDHNPPKRVASGVPHVTAKGIRDGRITIEGCTYISEDGYLQTANRYSPRAGDVIVTCVGTIGRVAVVPEGLRFSADRNLAAIRPGEAMLSGYLACVLESVTLQRTMATASGSTAQPHLYLRDIRSLEVPHPAVEHQAEAVERYQDARRAIGRLLVQLGLQRTRATSLRRAILAAAFSGRLTGHGSDTDVIAELADEESA